MGEKKLQNDILTDTLQHFSDFEKDLSQFETHLKNATAEIKKLVHQMLPSEDSMKYWGKLIGEWASNNNMPLYIRKSGYQRGEPLTHKPTGRILIPCDNGPAHWSYSMCFNGNFVSLEKISGMIAEDLIPIAYQLRPNEKQSKFRQRKHLVDQPNHKGWKIAHREEVGLYKRQRIEDMDIEELKMHFIRFLDPNNMFLIPLKYAGLAEIDAVLASLWKQKLNNG